jgi:ribulose kinase
MLVLRGLDVPPPTEVSDSKAEEPASAPKETATATDCIEEAVVSDGIVCAYLGAVGRGGGRARRTVGPLARAGGVTLHFTGSALSTPA